jgi:hypothetical protein
LKAALKGMGIDSEKMLAGTGKARSWQQELVVFLKHQGPS